MDIESIFRKPGRDWTPEEIQAVFDWLQREMLDKLLRLRLPEMNVDRWREEGDANGQAGGVAQDATPELLCGLTSLLTHDGGSSHKS